MRQGGWMQTYTGRQFWPLDPRPEEIDIDDIAHALSNICRFTGHCEHFYSVAEHSVLTTYLVSQENALWALLHDASEAYICDLGRPVKQFIPQYTEIENRLMYAVCERFNLPVDKPSEIKRADNVMLATEATTVMGSHPADWLLAEYPSRSVEIQCLRPAAAEKLFLQRFRELSR